MKVPLLKYSALFSILQKGALDNSSVLIIVAYDCDAIAACRLLKDIFSLKSIQSTTTPAAGMKDLESIYENLVKINSELKNIFLLNCGGNLDLFEIFHLDIHEQLNIFVADTHRPYHPSNIRNAKNIFLFDDSTSTDVTTEVSEAEIDLLASFESTFQDDSDEELYDEEDLKLLEALGSSDEDSMDEEDDNTLTLKQQRQSSQPTNGTHTQRRNKNINNDKREAKRSSKKQKTTETFDEEQVFTYTQNESQQQPLQSQSNSLELEQSEISFKQKQKQNNNNKYSDSEDEDNEMKRRVRDTYIEDDDDEDDEEKSFIESDEEDLPTIKRQKRKREMIETVLSKARTRKRIAKVGLVAASEESSHGFTSAGLLYAMALNLGISKPDHLWYGILGLTDQFVHQKIGRERYEGDLVYFAEQVKTIFPNSSTSSQNQQQWSSSGEIVYEPLEYIFMLYRHWNLYDSLYHTRNVAIPLRIYKEGTTQLDTWLARMGMPLDECKQKYVAMKKKFKDSLPEQIEKYAHNYNIYNIYVPAFVRKPNFEKEITSFDTIHGMSALLGSILATKQHSQQKQQRKQQAGKAGKTEPIVDEEDASAIEASISNFWDAYSSLAASSMPLLERGINEAIDLQKAIVRQACAIITSRGVAKTGQFRYATLKDGPDVEYFHHPLALCKLAHFLVDTLLEMGHSRSVKPLLLHAYLPNSNQYLLVGVEGQHSSSSYIPNRFGKAFAKAASATNIAISYSTFDTSLVQLPQSDLERFREYLRSGLLT